MCIEMFIFILESKAVKSSILKYAVQCLNGRLNWVPFIDFYEKCGKIIDFNKIEAKLGCLEVDIKYTFYKQTLTNLKDFLVTLPF